MANPLKGEVSLDIGGTPHLIRLDYNGLCEIEAETGKLTPELVAEAQAASFVAIRKLFWAGLRGGGNTAITEKEAGDLIQKIGVKPALDALTESFHVVFGLGDKPEGEDQNPT